MNCLKHILLFALAALILFSTAKLEAQVTTSSLYGLVRDTSGAVLPGATVNATNQGTNVSRDVISDERGEFALLALPPGPYTVRIELPGFRTYVSQGLALGAGQTTRQTYVLEVGSVAENITVAETAPLVDTISSAQLRSLGTTEVTQLPLARRNVQSALELGTGVTVDAAGAAGPGAGAGAGAGNNLQINGVGMGGSTVTVDGTDASGNSETRGMNGYGGQNMISVMSIEAVGEVQIVKGILPAEYGGVVGGQVNLLTRSGTNEFHGSLFENHQNEKLFARDPFLTSQPKPRVRFNQFGGAIGGPVIRNRAFFFAAYEGYRDTAGLPISGTVPTEQLRNQILSGSPFPETKMVMDTIPLPNVAVNANIGMWRGASERTRRDNTVIAKGDVLVFDGNFSVTYSRLRPFTDYPSIYIGPGNNLKFLNGSDRVATQYVLARGPWISESRFGWNRNSTVRVNDFYYVTDTGREEENLADVGRRLSSFNITGLFGTPTAEAYVSKGRLWSADQKFGRLIGPHNFKLGFRWARTAGWKSNPQNSTYGYQTLADFLANIPNSVTLAYGQGPHDAHLDEYSAFVQDDWRLSKSLVLNLGLRYDYYPTIRVKAVGDSVSEIFNLNQATDLRKLDFGSPRDPDKPYDADRINFGPRVGVVWTVDEKAQTVVRVGVGFLNSPHVFGTMQNAVTDPFVPARVAWNKTEALARGLRWPLYGEDLRKTALQDGGGKKAVFSIMDTHLPTPYTVQSMINVQRSFGATWMAEASYLRTDGRNFPLHRRFANAFDRQTGQRPNPLIGASSGLYISSEQTMVYNALQTSLQKRYANNLTFSIHYTLSRGWSEQAAALTSNGANSSGVNYTQDFWDPKIDRGPLANESRHRLKGDVIYELPSKASGALGQIVNGWRVSSVVSAISGTPLSITQPSGIGQSRPDFNGNNPVLENWGETLLFLDRAAFVAVPTYPVTGATTRPGTYNLADARSPKTWTVDMSVSKTFKITESKEFQIRAEAFNALNHVNYGSPNTSLSSPLFGQISTAGSARICQIGARFAF